VTIRFWTLLPLGWIGYAPPGLRSWFLRLRFEERRRIDGDDVVVRRILAALKKGRQ
jgi:hypothetical protein